MPIVVPLMVLAALCWFSGYDPLLSIWLMLVSIGMFLLIIKVWPTADWVSIDLEPGKFSRRQGVGFLTANVLGFVVAWGLNALTKAHIVNFADSLLSPVFAWIFGGKPTP